MDSFCLGFGERSGASLVLYAADKEYEKTAKQVRTRNSRPRVGDRDVDANQRLPAPYPRRKLGDIVYCFATYRLPRDLSRIQQAKFREEGWLSTSAHTTWMRAVREAQELTPTECAISFRPSTPLTFLVYVTGMLRARSSICNRTSLLTVPQKIIHLRLLRRQQGISTQSGLASAVDRRAIMPRHKPRGERNRGKTRAPRRYRVSFEYGGLMT
jgi:hypothetical protein